MWALLAPFARAQECGGRAANKVQVDITRSKPIDDNAFQAELSTIVENSFNIHQDGARFVFREEENPQAKLIANARNDKLFVDGSDKQRLALEARDVIGGTESVAKAFRVIILGADWTAQPWAGVDESDLPAQWTERIPLLVVPGAARQGRSQTRHVAKGAAPGSAECGSLSAAAGWE